jgi:hypothetical protein
MATKQAKAAYADGWIASEPVMGVHSRGLLARNDGHYFRPYT